MKAVYDPVKLLQKELQAWDTPFVELDCFGTDSAERIGEIIDDLVNKRLRPGRWDAAVRLSGGSLVR